MEFDISEKCCYGASKELTALMRRPKTISYVIWNTVELLIPGGQFEVLSRNDGIPFPALDSEPGPEDLFT